MAPFVRDEQMEIVEPWTTEPPKPRKRFYQTYWFLALVMIVFFAAVWYVKPQYISTNLHLGQTRTLCDATFRIPDGWYRSEDSYDEAAVYLRFDNFKHFVGEYSVIYMGDLGGADEEMAKIFTQSYNGTDYEEMTGYIEGSDECSFFEFRTKKYLGERKGRRTDCEVYGAIASYKKATYVIMVEAPENRMDTEAADKIVRAVSFDGGREEGI